MHEKTTFPPVVRTVTVPLPPEQAFELFTSGMGRWWPVETHSIAADTHEGRMSTRSLTFEPHLGGRIVETMSDGSEGVWGRVLEWAPPQRVAFTWKPNLRAAPYTRLDVSFSPADGGTRVELVHTGWEQLGADAEDRRRPYERGWDGVLARFAAAAAS